MPVFPGTRLFRSVLRVDHGRWDQTVADLRHLALTAAHPRSRERFLALHVNGGPNPRNSGAGPKIGMVFAATASHSLPSFDQKPTAVCQSPVNAVSRRWRWPKASVYRGVADCDP